MRVVLQRVKEASISIDGAPAQSIGPGLVLLFGVREGDTPDLIPKLAKKCANMRIFSDDEGRMNLSAVQLGYSALAASNFTLYTNTDKGMRPSFTRAAAPEPSLHIPIHFPPLTFPALLKPPRFRPDASARLLWQAAGGGYRRLGPLRALSQGGE